MTVDEIIAELDARFPAWELWRTADREWACRSSVGDQVQGAASLELALKSLLYYKPLPRIPRRPTLLMINRFTAQQSGSKWSLLYDGRGYSYDFATKKQAMTYAGTMSRMSSINFKSWHMKYSEIVASGKEGIDFIWED